MKAIDFLSAEDFLKDEEEESPYTKTNKKLKGYGEAALSMLAPLPSQIAGGIYGLNSLLSGQGLDKAANDVAKVQDWNFGFGAYKPTTEEGQQSSESLANMFAYPGEKAGDVGAWVGKKLGNEELGRLTAKLPVDVAMNWLPLHGIVKAPIKAAEGINALRNKKAPTPVSDMGAKVDALKTKQTAAEAFLMEGEGAFDNIRKSQGAPKELPIIEEVPPSAMEQMATWLEQKKARDAQEQLALRQQAMEQEVAKQTSLDQNAAERMRQEQAPTGYDAWAEQQRMDAEQRRPGDNTPMEMDSPYPVDVSQFPQVLKEAPYKHEGGLDFTPQIAEDLSLPVEKQLQQGEAWKQRNLERQAEQDVAAKQEQRITELEESLLPLEEQLRKQQYSPSGSGQGPKTRAEKARINKFGQGGQAPIIGDLAEGIVNLGRGIKARIVPKAPITDTLLTPTTQANIEAKALKRAKSNAIGYKGSAYDQVTTKEEALALAGKDLSSVTQELGAGIGGAVRRNANNGILKYTRYNLDQATNGMNAYIKQYITGKDGFNDTYSKLSKQDKIDAFALKKKLSEVQEDYTPEMGEQLGLTEPLKRHMESRKTAYEAMEAEWGKMNLEKGLETFEHRSGYLASIFDRNFQALVGKKMPDGSFKIDTMVGTKSRREFNQALKMYPDHDVIKLGDHGRTGLRQTGGKFQVADDMAFLLSRMAEHDPRFAEVKQELASAHAIRNKGYKNFDVHEMEKKGVKGFLGDKPWENQETNMKDALEAEIRYFDQAAKYVHGQRLLDKTHEIVTEIRDSQPNTAAYLDKYMNHLTGQSLDPIAGGINKIVDIAVKGLGHGFNKVGVRMPENPSGALRALGTGMNALMMNIYSPAMFSTQLAQLYISGIPEAAKVRAAYSLEPQQVATSMARAHAYRALIPALDKMGMLDQAKPPAHMLQAWEWIKKHGMDDFNEVMLSQDILQSKAMSVGKQAAFWPTVLPEKFTRPTMFMWMTDMFHEAGFRGEELMNRAKVATDYSMTDYRGEEAPLIYDKMGVLTPETSALQKYKHNALDQVTSRTMEMKQYPAAFLSALGLSIAFGGLLGLPAMQEIDELIVKPVTKKSSREHLESILGQGGVLADGAASAFTQLDMGSRFALSDTAPNSFGEAVAGARLSKAYKMVAASYDFAKNQDEASLKAMGKEFMPSGMSQAYQEQFMTDKEGSLLNKKGQVQFDHKRNKERLNRSALMGVRPLAEKQESERVWAASQRVIKLEEELAHATERLKIANNLGDERGFDKWLETFEEKEGNLKSLGGMLKQSTIDAVKTEKERRQGTPKKTPMSIRKFLEFNEED